jgi:protein-S-isoprenylcysteine O-methyltransferase Ste14
MTPAKDNPGVYVPPPLIYLAVFLVAMLCQRLFPIDRAFFSSPAACILGVGFILISVIGGAMAMRQFVKTRNTLVTIKPAHSLQTTGIYSVTRNPMYLSLLLLYTGLALLLGSWWTLLLLPVLIGLMARFVIRREEQYLERAFGDEYTSYKRRVRRWI